MTEPDAYSYPRYLDAKKTVDARALNRRVWTRFSDRLSERTAPIEILEVGAGVGATLQRIVEALEGAPPARLHYTFVDLEPENVVAARDALRGWAAHRGYQVADHDRQVWTDDALEVSIRFVTGDLFDVVEGLDDGAFDAVVAQAVLDLLHLPAALRALRPLLRSGGLWYLPIHFDGLTAFEPPMEAALDARIERLYHTSMSELPAEGERPAGMHCGRRLLSRLPEAGIPLLDTGSSDWVVLPRDGAYPGDEAYFLHHILHFVETELSGHPELDASAFERWVRARRRQIDDGELIYIAHQLDVLAQTP
jgi:SAM-dependent methyltransferase